MNNLMVLVIEDDKWQAEHYARVLNRVGYETIVAFDAVSAIQLIDDKLPDAIVLDVLLTGSTAFALLHELQSYSDTGSIPVILCTSLASDLSSDNLMDYGVSKVLDKTTMIPDDLVASLKAVL